MVDVLQLPWLGKLLGSLLAVLVVYILSVLARRMTKRFISEPSARYATNKRIFYISLVSAIVVVALIWAESLGSLTTMLGLLSAGLALALKDPISSLVGWFYITGSRLYHLGDRIEVGGIKGDIVDISMLTTTLVEVGNWVDGEQSTGRLVKIPNYWVFTHGVFNYTQAFPYVWTELSFVVTFESNWQKAAQILERAMTEVVGDLPQRVEHSLKQAQDQLFIHYRNFTPIVYVSVVGSGVKLTGRFLVETRQRRGREAEVTQKVLKRFDEEDDIALAYTTYRIVQ